VFDDCSGKRLAWLGEFDRHSWVARALTDDQAWTMTPCGRHRPDLAAVDLYGHTVARCHRPLMAALRVSIATERLRLQQPNVLVPTGGFAATTAS
jgi:hypothetical protein